MDLSFLTKLYQPGNIRHLPAGRLCDQDRDTRDQEQVHTVGSIGNGYYHCNPHQYGERH